MRNSAIKLSKEVEEKVLNLLIESTLEINYEEMDEVASKVESKKSYKIKDIDEASNYFRDEKLKIYEQNNGKIDKRSQVLIDGYLEALKRMKKIRKERNQESSQVETNLLAHGPYFAGGSKKRKEQAKKEGFILLEKEGIRKMTYENSKGEMLGMYDAKAMVALFSLWKEQGFPEFIDFNYYQMVEKMKVVKGGRQYELIDNSIEKLRHTHIVMQQSYDVKTGENEVTDSFPLLIGNRRERRKDTKGNVRSTDYKVRFHEYVRDSFQSGCQTIVSLAVFDELENDIARGLYLMLSALHNLNDKDKYILSDGSFEVPVKEIYDYLFLEANRPSKKEDILKAGLDDLKNTDIISDFKLTEVGKRIRTVILTPSQWTTDLLNSYDQEAPRIQQMKFFDDEIKV